jgi:SAM-dependent methyltransferase
MVTNEKQSWDEGYANLKLFVAPEDDHVRKWLEAYVPKGSGACMELGCFPGRYLSVLGGLGYTLNGIDFADRIESDLPCWLKSQGLKVGKFYKGDILELVPDIADKYDVVFSLGLIEHFDNLDQIIELHCKMVEASGYLILAVPNFAGMLQKYLHLILDKENYMQHNLAAMDPKLWESILLAHNYDIIFSGYFGGFDFWVGNKHMNIVERILLKVILKLRVFCKKMASRRSYSPYVGIIAKNMANE